MYETCLYFTVFHVYYLLPVLLPLKMLWLWKKLCWQGKNSKSTSRKLKHGFLIEKFGPEIMTENREYEISFGVCSKVQYITIVLTTKWKWFLWDKRPTIGSGLRFIHVAEKRFPLAVQSLINTFFDRQTILCNYNKGIIANYSTIPGLSTIILW